MSEVDLSDDYANSKYISNAESFPEKWQQQANNFRNERALFSNVELDIPYGPSDREKMDIFYPEKKSKLPIYIQGTNFVRPIKYFEKKD